MNDLEKRTLKFSKQIISLCKQLPKNQINRRLSDQCLRSGTSIGANYREANETDSKKDFQHRIRISKKEAKETIYWLKLLNHSNSEKSNKNQIEKLLNESEELMKILGKIYQNIRE